MATSSLKSLNFTTLARDNEEKRKDTRNKAMLLFAFQLLIDKGYLDTANCLASECSLNLEEYSICENIDLNSVFVEFETYYNIRFGRFPQYFKKSSSNSLDNLQGKLRKHGGLGGRRSSTAYGKGCSSNSENGSNQAQPSSKANYKIPEIDIHNTSEHDFVTHGSTCTGASYCNNPQNGELPWTEKLLKPISALDFGIDDGRIFAEMLQKEIILNSLDTKWEDVVGLDDAKMILQESLVLRKEFQEFFGSALPPWKGLMLYGPPGTGKTLLAKAVATECKTTFFNISSACIVSKWRGDSEKIVKILFDLARFHAPSTIFFDEFDALGSRRNCEDSDASRRLKSEILRQMDGLCSLRENGASPIFVLTATNLPWDVDAAMLRRFEKRIYIPLPGHDERRGIFHLNFAKISENVAQGNRNHSIVYQIDLDHLASVTERYSGSDINQIAKETLIRTFRENYAPKRKKLVILTENVTRIIESVAPTCNQELVKRYAGWGEKMKN